jgi:PST family polysaccharide transporter
LIAAPRAVIGVRVKANETMSGSVFQAMSLSVVLRLVRLVLSLGLIAALGRHLGVAEMGKLLSAQALVTVLLCVAELGFARITVRELVRHPEREKEILGATFAMRLGIGSGLFLVVIVAAFLPVFSADEKWLLWGYGLLLPTHCLAELGSWMEAQHRVTQVWTAQLIGFLCGAMLLGLGVCLDAPPAFFPLAYLTECWVMGALLWVKFRKAGRRLMGLSWHAAGAWKLLKESWPEMISQLALMMLFRVDTLMVKAISGAGAAGEYGVAVRLSEVLYFFPTALAGVMLPRLLARQHLMADDYRSGFSDYFGATWLMAGLGAAGLALVAGPMVVGLMGDAFVGSAAILSIHAWAFVPYALGIARTQHLTAEGRLWLNLPSVVVALIVNVGLNLAWIPKWQGLGAAWATLVAYTVAWVGTSVMLPQLRETARLQFGSLARMPKLVVRFWEFAVRRKSCSRAEA